MALMKSVYYIIKSEESKTNAMDPKKIYKKESIVMATWQDKEYKKKH